MARAIHNKLHYRWVILLGGWLLMAVVLAAVAYLAEYFARTTAQERMQNTLDFQTETLKVSMNKYGIMSALIAKRPDVVAGLVSANPALNLPQETHLAQIISALSGAQSIWIVDRQGQVLVSNEAQHVGSSIFSEDYFQATREGRLGRASQVSAEGSRYYIFASPIFNRKHIIGAVVVRVSLDFVEQVWALLPDPVLVTDAKDRVLLANIAPWRLRVFYRNNQTNNRSVVRNQANDGLTRLQLNQSFGDASSIDYLHAVQYIPLLDWQIHIMTDYTPIITQRNVVVLVTLLIFAVALMGLLMFNSRRYRLQREQRSQQAFALRLERQVRDRTRELTDANQQLEIEIDERKTAETVLRETQQELVQAAKLAGIGQMSAALAHEYNQPLAAIRSYAENASAFLAQEQPQPASDNLQRIRMLVDRMAELTKTLRSFAHKSSGQLAPINIAAVMDELLILLGPLANKQAVTLNLIAPSEPLKVMADHGRLSQVVTNLVTNAIDAVSDSPRKVVEITWHQQQDHAMIYVKDTGPGIDNAVRDKIGDAFFTTKNSGEGLGLGLFIVMNIVADFKGSLRILDEPGYGAVFAMQLPLAEAS